MSQESDQDQEPEALVSPDQDGAELKAAQRDELMPLPYKYRSATLEFLGPDRTSFRATLCEYCKNSVWKSTGSDLTCYCRVLLVETWTQGRESVITACDGALLVDQEETDGDQRGPGGDEPPLPLGESRAA